MEMYFSTLRVLVCTLWCAFLPCFLTITNVLPAFCEIVKATLDYIQLAVYCESNFLML